MNKDTMILRELARKVHSLSKSDKNREKIEMHKAVNDLKQTRPVVLIDELPWSEMNIDNELTMQCENPEYRNWEWHFREILYRNKYFPADMVIPPFFPVPKIVEYLGNGLDIVEDTIATDGNHIMSHEYKNILKTEDDINKIKNQKVIYRERESLAAFNLAGELFGDIIPVKMTGIGMVGAGTWDDISRYMGVENLLMSLAEAPEFMHKIVRRLTDDILSVMDQYEELGLLDNDLYSLHCTCALTDDLSSETDEYGKLTRKNVWGRGAAQIFGSVSKSMHDEFDIEYMKETIGQCGLVYYGCCEPLHAKIDIVEKIPNIRKISVTPWADVNMAAEIIQNKYVLASKPNPASVAVSALDTEALKKEISLILAACKRNNCSADIVLKDISTCNKNPNNIFEWQNIVMEMVENY